MEQFGEEAGGFKFGKQRPRSLGANCLVEELPPGLCSSPGLWAQRLHLGRGRLRFVIVGGGG